MPETDPNFWETYTRAYDAVIGNFSKHQELVDLHADELASCGLVLDSGCGPGHLVKKLLDSGKKVSALDVNQNALDILKERCGQNTNLDIYCTDANRLPFQDSTFDGVSSMLVLWAIKDPFHYLEEHRRVIKPNGRLVLSGPSPKAREDTNWILSQLEEDLRKTGRFDAERWREFLAYTRTNVSHTGENWLNDSEVKGLLEQSRYKIISIKPNPIYFGRGHVVTALKG
jgi:ubiquinone/menaquinone biosynthesis C-methylase UbiE